MRSRLICSLASAGFALFVACTAQADVTRLRVAIDELPLQDKETKVDPKNAVLPSGARDHGPVPKSWRVHQDSGEQMENARCEGDRRGSVSTIYGTTTWTQKIWEANGKTFLDRADIETAWLFVEVKRAVRVELARLADGLWGYRSKDTVVLVAALDTGSVDEGGFYECSIAERQIPTAGGTTLLVSSPKEVNDALDQIAKNMAEPGKAPKWHPQWTGVELRVLASVAESSSDPKPMLNLVIKKP